MPTMETGHEHEGRNAVITLNTPMLEGMGQGRERELVDALVDVARRHGSEGDAADLLAERLDSLGIRQPRPVIDRMAENLRNGEDLMVVTDDGRVLHGDPSWTPATINPDVEGTEDPTHGERPFYS